MERHQNTKFKQLIDMDNGVFPFDFSTVRVTFPANFCQLLNEELNLFKITEIEFG